VARTRVWPGMGRQTAKPSFRVAGRVSGEALPATRGRTIHPLRINAPLKSQLFPGEFPAVIPARDIPLYGRPHLTLRVSGGSAPPCFPSQSNAFALIDLQAAD
jgi:hypothetical protein